MGEEMGLMAARAEYDAAVRVVAEEPEWTSQYPHLLLEREANTIGLAEAWDELVVAIREEGAAMAAADGERIEALEGALREHHEDWHEWSGNGCPICGVGITEIRASLPDSGD